MKKSLLVLFLSTTLFACTNNDNSAKQEIFDRNVTTMNNALDAFANEDVEAFGEFFADSLKWVGTGKLTHDDYSSKSLFIEELNKYFSLYHDHTIRDRKITAGSVYSTDQPSNDPNQLQIFGNRYHIHSGSSKEVGHKWMAVVHFNQDGKIDYFSDFFDFTGFLKQHED